MIRLLHSLARLSTFGKVEFDWGWGKLECYGATEYPSGLYCQGVYLGSYTGWIAPMFAIFEETPGRKV